MITLQGDGAVIITVRGFPGWTFAVAPSGALTVAPPAGEKITAEKWRTMPIGRILADARREQQGDLVGAWLSELAEGTDGDPVSARKNPREHRLAVARVYRMALQQGLPPAAMIARHWTTDPDHPVSEVTARRWIASIRRTPDNPEGLLDDHATEKARATAYEPHRRPSKGNGRSPGRGSTARKETR